MTEGISRRTAVIVILVQLVLISILFLGNGSSDTTFQPSQTAFSLGQPFANSGVVAFDVDGDLDLDFFSKDNFTRNIGSSFEVWDFPGFYGNSIIVDMNYDGKADLVADSRYMTYSLMAGTPYYTYDDIFTVNDRIQDAADYNGDGKMDYLVEDLGSGDLSMYVDNGFGGYITQLMTSSNLRFCDVDKDGLTDLVDLEATLKFHIQLPPSTIIVSTGIPAEEFLGLVDVNCDGHLDIVTQPTSGGFFKFHINDQNLVFSEQTSSAIGMPGDVDSDGDVDFVYQDSIKYNDGSGGFYSAPKTDNGLDIAIADCDNDGDLDVIEGWDTILSDYVILTNNKNISVPYNSPNYADNIAFARKSVQYNKNTSGRIQVPLDLVDFEHDRCHIRDLEFSLDGAVWKDMTLLNGLDLLETSHQGTTFYLDWDQSADGVTERVLGVYVRFKVVSFPEHGSLFFKPTWDSKLFKIFQTPYTEFSEIIYLDIEPPKPPTFLHTKGRTTDTIDLEWNPSPSFDLSHYQLFINDTDSDTLVLYGNVGNGTYKALSGLPSGTNFTFALSAVDKFNNTSNRTEPHQSYTYSTNIPPTELVSPLKITTPEDTGVTVDLHDYFQDFEGDPLSFSVFWTGNVSGELQSNGVASFIPAPDYTGMERIQVQASDGMVHNQPEFEDTPYAVLEVQLTVEPVDDPLIVNIGKGWHDLYYREDHTAYLNTLDITASDADNVVDIKYTATHHISLTLLGNGSLAVSSALNWSGTGEVIATINNGTGNIYEVAKVFVHPRPDAPIVVNVTIDNPAPADRPVFFSCDIVDGDFIYGDTVSVKWYIDGEVFFEGISGNHTFDPGIYDITVTAKDSAGYTGSKSIKLTVAYVQQHDLTFTLDWDVVIGLPGEKEYVKLSIYNAGDYAEIIEIRPVDHLKVNGSVERTVAVRSTVVLEFVITIPDFSPGNYNVYVTVDWNGTIVKEEVLVRVAEEEGGGGGSGTSDMKQLGMIFGIVAVVVIVMLIIVVIVLKTKPWENSPDYEQKRQREEKGPGPRRATVMGKAQAISDDESARLDPEKRHREQPVYAAPQDAQYVDAEVESASASAPEDYTDVEVQPPEFEDPTHAYSDTLDTEILYEEAPYADEEGPELEVLEELEEIDEDQPKDIYGYDDEDNDDMDYVLPED